MDYTPLLQDEPLILAVAGAREWTGKSLISTNMAIMLAQAGLHIVLVDHDLSAANMHSLYATDDQNTRQIEEKASRYNLEAFLKNEGIPNLLIIPGSNFGNELPGSASAQKHNLFQKVREIKSADIAILDLGGGASEQNLDLFLTAHAGILVTTTEPAGVIEGYEFLKNAVYRTIFRMFRGQEEILAIVRAHLQGEEGEKGKTISELASAIAAKNPWAAQNLLGVCSDFNFYAIFNQARAPQELSLGTKLHTAAKKFLEVDLGLAGLLYHDKEISVHADEKPPLSISHPESPTCQALSRMAALIIDDTLHQLTGGGRKHSFEEQLRAVTTPSPSLGTERERTAVRG